MKYTFVSLNTNERFELEFESKEDADKAKARFVSKYKYNCYYFNKSKERK